MLQESIKSIYATHYDDVIVLARYGIALAEKQNDPLNMGDFMRTIGLALGRKGNIDSASVYYYNALKILEPTQNAEKLGLLYDDMARMYRKLKQPERALEFYDKALKLYEHENNLEGIARILNESGAVYRDDLADYTLADQRFKRSLQIQIQRKDSIGMGYSLEFLGYNHLKQKDYQQSEDYFLQALRIRENSGDDFALMLNYTALGEYYRETKKYALSNEYFERSNAIAIQIGFSDIQRYNYQQLMANQEAVGNYAAAYQSLKAYHMLNDSLYNIQKLKDVEEITARYETAEKEKLIAEKEFSLKIRNQWIYGLAAFACIIGFAGFLLYKQQVLKNIKQKNENELKMALEKIESQNKLQEQRLSISRDLHDNIGAQLSFIVSAIDTVRYYIPDKKEPLDQRLQNIGTFAKETIQELRDTIWAMNKSGITIVDLQSRIVNYIEKANESNPNVQIKLLTEHIPADKVFTGLQGLNIFRIIQEAINNALKYAHAKDIEVHIYQRDERFHFLITDNGDGFDEKQITLGNGLLNMRKRALELGSTLTLESEINKGTRVVFSTA